MLTKRPHHAKPTRREMLIKSAAATLAATGLGTNGVVFAQNVATRTPGETEGPYWIDVNVNRSDVRSNTATGVVQAGFPLQLGINVSQLASNVVRPVRNAKVDIWHCSATGVYSAVAAQNTLGQNFLRGYQLTNAHGNTNFISIYPGWYSGRTLHIHFRIRLYSGTTVTYNFVSQLYFLESVTSLVYANAPYNTRPNRDTFNSTDMVYTGPSQGNGGSVSSNSGQYLLLRLAKDGSRAVASFNVVL